MLTPKPGLPNQEALDTHRKALAINLDARCYGTFAEIGAGQEVARWFFRVGGAAGTIAKSMSAYDMAVSDAIYGHTERYVSRDRLQSMLDYEHEKNVKRLSAARGDTTAFFVFADTVTAKGFRNTSECHGWMGIKFQSHPRDDESQILLHVRMLDRETSLQQEALGIVGVNLLYGAFFMHHEPERLVESLLDNLTTERLEIDMIEFSGIEFRHVDNRLMSLKLVQLGLSQAAMFGPKGEVLQPSEVLHHKPVLVLRGTFRPVTKVNVDMLRCARTAFAKAQGTAEENIVEIMEITMRNLLSADGALDPRDFLARADVLGAAGKTVLVSDYFEYYRLAGYLRRCTSSAIAIVLGTGALVQLLDEKYYTGLSGGIMEAFGRLFSKEVKLLVYPMLDPATGKLVTAPTLEVPAGLAKLYGYLLDRGVLVALEDYDPSVLPILSQEVYRRLKAGDSSWEAMVPEEVVRIIKRRGLFGHASRP
ncbi:MAG TPA: TonB-dependent receptor [Polyangia bacterium]